MKYNRIISLVPSLTQLVLDLGLKDRLVGRTRFCIHPADLVDDVPIIGGTKTPNIGKILSLEPDYIIANHEENRKEDIELLQEKNNVTVTQIDTIEEAIDTILTLGKALEVEIKAQKLVEKIQSLLSETPKKESIKVAYFIWRNPWMVAAKETYIDSVLEHYHLENIFSDSKRYPQVSLKELSDKSPELILLSSEPYPFKEKYIKEIEEVCPDAQIELINGEWFSWYGSGMTEAFEELNTWRLKLSNT
jgi:ABC-type Fe3+-hydroxamate transport system substrate-binding protein